MTTRPVAAVANMFTRGFRWIISRRTWVLAAAAVLLLVRAQAQISPNDTGTHDYETYDGAHESVSLGSGNLFVSVPLLTLPGRNGLNYSVSLISNSQSWYFNGGWQNNGLGMIVTRTGAVDFHPGGVVYPPNTSNIQCLGNYSLTDENGGVHTFSNLRSDCMDPQTGPPTYQPTPEPSYDVLSAGDDRGEGISIDLNACTLTMKDGRFYRLNGCPTEGYIGDGSSNTPVLEDPNGNEIISGATGGADDVTGSGEGGGSILPTGTDTDTLQRGITYNKSNGTIQYKDSAGTVRTITLIVQQEQVSCTLSTSGGGGTVTGSYSFITAAVLPNGLAYIFQYDSCGNLTKIVYPSGGYTRYQYDYADYTHVLTGLGTPIITGSDMELVSKYVCRAPSVTPGATSTGTGDTCPTAEDQTTYTPTVNSTMCNHSGTTVVDPLGDKTVYQFTNNATCGFSVVESSRQIYQGSSTLLRTVQTQYYSPSSYIAYPQDQTTVLPNGLESKIHWDRGVGQTEWVQDTKEYDWNNGAPGPLVRETVTPIACNWKAASTTIEDGSGNQIAKTVYEFDNYTAGISPSGAVEHDSSFGTSYTTRCNITAVEKWRNTDGKILTTRMQYDDAGNVVSSTDPLNHITTTTSYSDVWANNACAPTGGAAAAYPTEITIQASAGTLISKHSYNSCSGTLASTTDPNTQATTFSYDLMGRNVLTSLPDGGSVSTCYSDVSGNSCYSSSYPIKIVSTQAISASPVANKVSTTVLDGLARVSETQLNSDPGCSSGTKIDISYDGDGHKSIVSNPYCSTSDPTYGTTTYQYDALNRVTKVIHPDQTNITTSYDMAIGVANCERVADEDGKYRTLCSDGLGRQTSAFEAPTTLNYETDYQYDALDDLLRVDQKGGDSNSTHWHTRQFTYDSLSHLLTASNPESGTICYGTLSGSTCEYGYDDDGNLLHKTDARDVETNYSYDTLNRVIAKTYSNDSTDTPVSCYQFGTSPDPAMRMGD